MSELSISAPRRRLASPAAGLDLAPPPLGSASAPDGLGQVEFMTDADSPFADGYSIAMEEEAMADMAALEHPDQDPRWPRYALLIQRKESLERTRLEYRLEQGADKTVPFAEAHKITALGALVNEGEDSMALHTKEAFRLFMGRRMDPDRRFAPIIGSMRCASALRGFWAHSANDNPVADWALLRGVQGLRQFGSDVRQLTDKHLGRLRDLAAKGLSFTVLRSAEPQAVPLTFKSPYGYLVATFTVDYDYFVRVIKTAVRKGLLTDQEGHDAIRAITRRVRGWMEELARFETFLWKPQLIRLTRADYLPSADAEARKRVEAVTAIFGPVPADIFSGRIQPPYTKRRMQITDAERALLERVGQELAATEASSASTSDASEAKLL